MRILIVTDAWAPQINGVVRTLQNTIRCLKHNGHDVSVISPEQFKTVSCPGYPEIPLSLASKRQFTQLVEAHFYGRPFGLTCQTICTIKRSEIHNGVSHSFSRVCTSLLQNPTCHDVSLYEVVSSSFCSCHGPHTDSHSRAYSLGFQESGVVVPWG
jgi:hypothetical protein